MSKWTEGEVSSVAREGDGGRTLPSSGELDPDLLVDVLGQIEDLLSLRLLPSTGLASASTTASSSSSATPSAVLVASALSE